MLRKLFIVEPIPVLCLNVNGESRLQDKAIWDRGTFANLLAKPHSYLIAEFFADQRSHHLRKELRVLLVEHF